MLATLLLLLLAAPGAPSEGAVTIRGRTVDSETGEPLDHVPVELFQMVDLSGRAFPEPWVPDTIGDGGFTVARVESGSDGSFAFQSRPGRFEVRAKAGGAHAAVQVAAFPGEPVPEAILAVPGGPDLSGVVVDGEGRPLAGVWVYFPSVQDEAGGNSLRGRVASGGVQTGDDGSFRLRWGPTGVVRLQAGRRDLGYSDPLPIELDDRTRLPRLRLLVPDEREQLAASAGDDGRIGIYLDFTPEGPVLSQIVPGSAAERAGLREGDLVLAVGGIETKHRSAREFIQRVRGPAGSALTLGVERGERTLDVRVVRAPRAEVEEPR